MDSFAFNETSGHVSILLKVTAILHQHKLFFGELAITERPWFKAWSFIGAFKEPWFLATRYSYLTARINHEVWNMAFV